jgi:Mrp family chromosome partitioning ATPase
MMKFGRKGPSALADIPDLGRIPIDNTPGLAAAPIGDLAAAYAESAQAVDGSTVGKIFIMTSPAPGQGATTVTANLAIAASRYGRRVLLIDGDTSSHGLSRFLSTGAVPGLTELAAGDATVRQAARMWVIDDRTRFPMIPSGAAIDNPALLSGLAVSDAIEVVAESADLVLIDSPPVGWSDTTPHLAVHADGSILVVSEGADDGVVTDAAAKLEEVGAPVVGYITNRAR